MLFFHIMGNSSDLKVLAVIPARGGSKGLINKNLLEIAGKSLIEFPIEFCLRSKIVTHTVVSTDSDKIQDKSLKCGALVPFLRPPDLSSDLATTESVLKHAIDYMESNFSINYDYCVFMTATSIFRPENLIERGIEFLEKNHEVESYFTGFRDSKNYWELDSSGNFNRVKSWMKEYSSRQIRSSLIREDTGIGTVSRSQLWRDGSRIGNKVHIENNPDPFSSIDIHSLEDFRLAEFAHMFRNSSV